MNIIIVDDSKILRQRLKRLLSAVPDTHICGETGQISEAIELIKNLTPDVIILDIQLMDGLGFDVYDQVISEKYKPVTIVLTNYPTRQYQQMCDQRRIEYFFDKTTDFEKIAATLKEMKSNEPKTF
ncbi:MAG: response regulator transcription factor [Candidatus Marinimicrobia bacterium]|nr:response regulator transcription factor [Candidatus Neomarinimicrobiota bacterium]